MTEAIEDIAAQKAWIARLIAYDTTSRNSNLALIDDVEDFLRRSGAATFRVPNDDGTKTNLYGVVGPMAPGGVVLSGHTDVVPVDGQSWESDPFTLAERGDKLYGRGACDMKSFSAVALSLVEEMRAAELKRPIIFALSYDEEVGCLGAPRMIDEIIARLPRPEAVIVGEPTMMKVVDGHKGIASFRTTVTGFTPHSSQTDRGVSAVEGAAKLIAKIAGMRETRARNADPDCPFSPPHSTMTVNVVDGGTQLNIMAASCAFEWDCRVVPGETAADIFDEFADAALGVQAEMREIAGDCRVDTEQLTNAPSLAPRADNPAADLAKALTGHNATEVVSYAAEAGQFQAAGLPTVICGPGSIDQAHQANEYVSVDQVAQSKAFMRRLIARLAA
ncbi:MAG: acetylornithine deacetylase [Parvularculaceae bacterium]